MTTVSRRGTSNSNQRGSSYSRRVRKQWLLDNFGDGTEAPCHKFVACGEMLTFRDHHCGSHPARCSRRAVHPGEHSSSLRFPRLFRWRLPCRPDQERNGVMPNSGTAFYPTPNKISNRALVKRMKAWGWREGKTRNGLTEMSAPNGFTIEVAAASHHSANKSTTITSVLNAMGVSWEQFISYDFGGDEIVNILSSLSAGASAEEAIRLVEALITAKRLEHETADYVRRLKDAVLMDRVKAERRREREERRTEAVAAPAMPKPGPPPSAPPEPYAVSAKASEGDAIPVARLNGTEVRHDRTVRISTEAGDVDIIGVPKGSDPESWTNARHVDRVLSYLMDAGCPVPLAKMADDMVRTRAQIGGACTYLLSLGLLKRVKHGVYAIDPSVMKRGMGVDVMHRTEEHADVAALLPPAITPTNAVAIPAPIISPADAIDFIKFDIPMPPDADVSVINDVLDLMFPNGFKAKHLPLIDRWRKVTTDLINEIGKG